ncbi:TonB-dependent receptor [bacterium]|nr:TonB-dependent receptor [candidate division CSSED10-310 bacterium]
MKRIEKNITCNHSFFLLSFLLFFFHSISLYSQEDLAGPATSSDDALEEELRYLQAETYVITASRIPESIKKSASSITVITDKQIRQMGARHLAEVLQTAPGMNIWYDPFGTFLVGVRGDVRNFQNVILLMVNGHPINDGWRGAATYTHDTMILDNVKRIEVIRGPGSALYGANAFAGVINVITKEAEDVDGWELSTCGGSYDTQQYNLLYGKTHNDLKVVFNYNYFNTHGFRKHVNRDAMYPLPSSLAPGRIKGDDEKYDFVLNLEYKGLKFDGRYVDREKDLPIGSTTALNEGSVDIFKDYYLNVSYERPLREDLTFLGKVYRNHFRIRQDQQFFPPGVPVRTPWGISIMKDGIMNIQSVKDNRTGFEIQVTYWMSGSNTLVVGTSYEEMKQFDPKRQSNTLLTSISLPFSTPIIPLPSVRDLSDIQNANKRVKRNFKAFFLEDVWDITGNLHLTVGLRWDDYSDFGSEVSPRAGLTWEFFKGYDLKLLYGHAFRAPSFLELYNVRFAEPHLDPETIDTYEISLGAEFTPSLSSRTTFFHNEGKDNVVALGEIAQNEGKTLSQGVELEARYDFGRGSYLSMNYTYIRWVSPHVGLRNWWAPRHMGNVMANVRLSRYLNFFVDCHIEDGFRRNIDDPRDDMSGFAIVNTTLIATKFLKGYENLELRGSIYNLFDKDYTKPSYPELYNDMPQPGRTFLMEVKYKF